MVDDEIQGMVEGVGSNFSESQLLNVRARTWSALNEIASIIQPGMYEEAARLLAADVLRERGLRKGWHKILVRFGVNSTKNFGDPSEPGVSLGENDVFFIDIGPIFDTSEGDAGDTFTVGVDADMRRAVVDVRRIWYQVRQKWLDEGLSGAALYAYAQETTHSLGWDLNLTLTGHRLADYPHATHFDGKLSAIGFRPTSGLWVLEVQIRHPEREFGAFFEDLLIEEEELQRTV